MMSALGGTPRAGESTDKLRECENDKGGGGPKIPLNEPIRVCARMAAANIDHIS